MISSKTALLTGLVSITNHWSSISTSNTVHNDFAWYGRFTKRILSRALKRTPSTVSARRADHGLRTPILAYACPCLNAGEKPWLVGLLVVRAGVQREGENAAPLHVCGLHAWGSAALLVALSVGWLFAGHEGLDHVDALDPAADEQGHQQGASEGDRAVFP